MVSQELRQAARAAHVTHQNAIRSTMVRVKEAFAPISAWSKTSEGREQIAEWKRQTEAEAAFARSGVVLRVPPVDPRT